MASKKQVTILYLCTEFLCYISFIVAATIFKDNLELTVPNNAKIGHVITKLGCSDFGLALQVEGNPQDDQLFNKLFSIDKNGNLVVEADLSQYEGKYFIVSVFSDKNCFNNVGVKRTFGVFIQNSNEYLEFGYRIYRGFIRQSSQPGYLVDGLDTIISDSKLSCFLNGDNSELFEIQSSGLRLHNTLPTESKAYYFTLQCSNGETHGHAGIHISVTEDNPRSDLHIRNQPSERQTHVAIRQDSLVKSFNQESINLYQQPHSRVRRDTVTKSLSATEGTVNILTLDSPQPGATLQWSISQDDTDTFQINSIGQLSVKDGKQLDYDHGRRSYTIGVDVKTLDGQTVLRIYQVDITVTDKNDENPVISNHPRPFQATVEFIVSAGTQVYQLTAFDPDTTSDVKFYIAGTNEDFDVEPNSGWIKTKRTLNQNTNYVVKVYAQDTAASEPEQRSATESVSIYTGSLSPQFNETSYTAKVQETNQPDQTFSTLSPDGHLSLVYAINFQKTLGGNTVYTVYDGNSISTKFKIDNTGHLVTLTSLDYEADPTTFNLIIRAKDTHSELTSSVVLTVTLEDRNEFDPTFTLSTYTKTIAEDLAPGSSILTVTASDQDLNTVLKFWVSDPLFRVQNLSSKTGELQVNSTLDYDRQQSHRYEFDIYVEDNGVPPRKSQAKILIDLTNKNDEWPDFQDENMVTTIKDNIDPGSTVFIVQAVDLDGDVVSYSFQNNQQNIFEIASTTGRIRYRQGVSIPNDPDTYVLTVLAKDDGSCCPPDASLLKTSTSTVTINIVDAVNTKPSFTQCNTYTSSVKEEQPIGTSVFTVSATDDNRGENGMVEYFAVTPPNGQSVYFAINQTSGEITTTAVLDRESFGSRYLFFTVRAVDKGQPRGDDYCTFPISITDVNDNNPAFGESNYQGSILRTAAVGSLVMTVKATDKDIGANAEVTYAEVQDTPYFNINPDSGAITVVQTLNSASNTITFTVNATDKGTPRLGSNVVTITIAVTSDDGGKPPVWSNSDPTFTVNETMPIDTLVGSLTATSQIAGSLGVTFTVISNGQAGSQAPPFRIMSDTTDTNRVNIYLLNPLDYEEKSEYINYLQLRAKDTSKEVYTDVFPKIVVIDQNDEIPQFAGADPLTTYIEASVLENQSPPAVVATVAATDADINLSFKRLSYSLFGPMAQNFTIDNNTGVISTSSMFDREATSNHYYLLQVKVEDGFPSARPSMIGDPNSDTATVRVKIADINDNKPKFENNLYKASVNEDAFISSIVTTIEAKDEDEATFTYSIDPNSPGAAFFAIKTQQLVGEIVVAGNLDYENGAHAYNLTVIVDDQLFNASTLVEISIIDVNDNPPVFSKTSYVIDDVKEEVQYSTSNPRYLLTANATDPDKFRDSGMEYRISDENAVIKSLFSIDSTTGVLNLIGKLDRDRPNGREIYQFNIEAVDEPGSITRLTGYATVQIKPRDINDNAPVFTPANPKGSVDENSVIGQFVMTVIAEDYDAGVNAEFTFLMVGTGNPRQAFRIQPDGQVFTTVSNLDRENEALYTFVVTATDNGTDPQAQTSTATVTINIKDLNDNDPVFEKNVYSVTIPETHTGVVITISANDPDSDDTLKYSLNQAAYKHFTMTTQGRQGILGVFNGSNPDYEKGETFFNLTAEVFDGVHYAYTNILITIEDVNDETPIFTVKNVEKTYTEGRATPINTVITNFTATDRDNGDNGKIRYYISGSPVKEEPTKYFSLLNYTDTTTGLPSTRVSLIKELDRETIAKHTVYILAMDSGIPQKTGTATLTINVADINDEYPRIKGVPYAKIMENQPAVTKVTTIFGQDPDSAENGPPFGFEAIPCTNNEPQCKFTVNFLPDADSGNGGADIYSKQTFDRELQKFYYLPIKMWDKRGVTGAPSMTGTNTLTIEIGDANDNVHGPGTQNIHVYNYLGKFKNIIIGAVNYDDLDDHDIADKTFVYKEPAAYKSFFSVDKNSGMITMLHNVPLGTWTFKVDVSDRVDGLTTTSTVTVLIEELPEEAPYMSGSVRLKGTTPEKFIQKDSTGKSPYDKFRERLATILNTDKENANMISVLSPKTDYTDLRFSAHGSPYYSPTKMNGVIMKNKSGFQQDSGATIEMINIDECLQETCESGCYNFLNVTGKPNMVNIRGSSIVGVETFVQGKCGCHEPVSQKECDATYCYNGGTCKKDYWNVLSCTCLAGFDGPRCQSTRHGFDGTGYALYKPLEQCENSETSIEFITTQDNGLLLYNGPVTNDFVVTDYLSLELSGGYPILKIDHGSGVKILTLTAQNGASKLSDGEWHHINIIRRGKLITMTVDYCRAIQPTNDAIVDDRSKCEVIGSTPGENMFLNVNAPLQMGGRYTNVPSGITTNKFSGCVRNLRHNNELYDLYTGSGTYPGSTDGCPREDDACNKNSVNLPKKCGDHGDCQITDYNTKATICICHSGYRGDNCEKEASIKDLKTTESYMDWLLTSGFQNVLSQWKTDVHVMYRTRDNDGVIFHVSSTVTAEFIRLEIVSNRLQILYNLGDGNHVVSLDKVPASDGQWHEVRIKRRGKFLSLSMDNGEGIHYSDTYGPDYGHHLLQVKQNQIYTGAALNYDNATIQIEKDLNSTCLRDIRLANVWFPMTMGESAENTNVKLNTQQNTADNCIRNDCENIKCPDPFVCRPLWEAYECVCPMHYVKVGSNCEAIDYCGLYTPCHPDATCRNNPFNADYGYDCICHTSWTGRTCYTAPVVGDKPASAALEIIIPVVILLVLIVLIIGFLLWWKCRRTEDVLIDDEKEDYEVRENVMDYDEEGAGEDDYEGHITGLGRLPDPSHFDKPVRVDHLNRGAPPPGGPGIGDFIGDRLDDANDDSGAPPHDTMKEFDYEGGGSEAGSLSSLNTSTSGGDQDYDYLNEWGPKFAKLADMYNNPNYEDSD